MNKSLIISVILFIFLILENIFPLRSRRDAVYRYFHNFTFAALGLPLSRFITYPLVLFFAHYAEENRVGILNALNLNQNTHFICEFIILDYALYWWHVSNHKFTFFWRFHQVHHVDRDMDSSTALRFHFGELFFSALIRCCLIIVIGIRIETILCFDIFVTSAAIFHHSNLKLPFWFEKGLSLIIVTPLFHQNHHSYYLEETDSNYSTIFNFWDRLHRSKTLVNKAEDITIGHPTFSENELKFLELIKMPFKPIKKWILKYHQRN